ncbi:hypothetical protein KI688_011558 [Linnemannia hyalina]|uniref:Uncharacterized protein n=1 Tax=Linnemannia hyalina TaxID=64524 RepID=A0A9P7XVL9_9FUNG|nr:hypothetical protein KI688_011558 [Linnemannia hyalina]
MATAQAFTSSSSSTPPNNPSSANINSIEPGTVFSDDSPLTSFVDSGDFPYDSPTLSSPPPHTANKSGGGDGSGSNGGGGGGWDHIGQIEVNSTIETILVVLGFGVGALFVLGVVAMYYITHKNRRAEEKKKRREEESAGAKFGQSSTPLPLSSLSSSSSSSSLPSPSHPNISAGTGTTAAAAVGRENPAHRIIITRSMTATTANTRVGAGGPNDEKDNGGGSGGLSPIGDGKSDMVSIYIDEMPDDDEIRARHHCDDDGHGGCEEKQELDEKEDDEKSPSQERNLNPMNAYSSPHNGL